MIPGTLPARLAAGHTRGASASKIIRVPHLSDRSLRRSSGGLSGSGLMGDGSSSTPSMAGCSSAALPLAGPALGAVVAVQMTVASVVAVATPGINQAFSSEWGMLLVAWLGAELAFIQVYS